MNDRELLRKLLYLRDWTQEELAVQLGVTQAMISNVITQKRKLHPERRRLAEQLLEQSETRKEPLQRAGS